MRPLPSLIRIIPRYTLVALALAGLHNATLIAADASGAHFIVAQAISAAILLPTGFLAMARFSYAVEANWSGFARYSAALITNFPVAIAALWLLIDWLTLPMWLAAPISTAVLFIWNFLTSTWAFLPSKQRVEGYTP